MVPGAELRILGEVVLEAVVKKAVKKRLKELGAYQHWPVQTGRGTRTLDCIGCYKGLYFAIETKRPGKLPTMLQNNTMEEIQQAGGMTFVIDTPEAARDFSFPNDNQQT
jgi:penicillin-binding protein-related factor A (putative recombinase)